MKQKFVTVLTLIGLAVLIMAAGWASKNYRTDGGDRWVVSGQLDIATGGDIDIETGGALKIAGTQVTSSAPELNLLDGFDLLKVGTVDIGSEQTTASATVAGVTAGDIPILTPNESLTSATKFHAYTSADKLNVAVDQAPGTTVTLNYLIFSK